MSITVAKGRFRLQAVADKVLAWSAIGWFAVAVAGQLVFAAGVAVFYGRAVLRGDRLA